MFTADEGQSQPVWAAAGSLVELEFTGRCESKGGMCGVVVVIVEKCKDLFYILLNHWAT